jgi:hypothetical protein
MRGYYPTRVAPFGYLRLSACLTAPRSFSQLATPFIASPRLGIHHTPFVACPSSLHVELPRAYTRFLLNFPTCCQRAVPHSQITAKVIRTVIEGKKELVPIRARLFQS